jgi:hypothetical protein
VLRQDSVANLEVDLIARYAARLTGRTYERPQPSAEGAQVSAVGGPLIADPEDVIAVASQPSTTVAGENGLTASEPHRRTGPVRARPAGIRERASI